MEPIQGTGSESQGARERRDHPNRPAQTPHTSDEDAEAPEVKGHVQGQMAINVQPTTVPTSPPAPAPKLPSTPHNMNDSLGHSLLLRKDSNFTSSRKANCKWGEEGYKS